MKTLFPVLVWCALAVASDLSAEPVLVPQVPHHFMVVDLDLSPDGKLLASISANGQIQIHETATGALLETYKFAPHASPGEIVMSPDCRYLALTSGATGVIDRQTGETRLLPIANDSFQAVGFTPDSQNLLALWGFGLHVFEAGKWESPVQAIAFPEGHWVSDGYLTKAGTYLSLSRHGEIKEWDLRDGTELRTLPGISSAEIYHSTFSPSGRWIAVTDFVAAKDGDSSFVIDLQAESPVWKPLPQGAEGPFAFHPNEQSLFLTMEQGRGGRRVWQLRREMFSEVPTDRGVPLEAADWSDDGELMAWATFGYLGWGSLRTPRHVLPYDRGADPLDHDTMAIDFEGGPGRIAIAQVTTGDYQIRQLDLGADGPRLRIRPLESKPLLPRFNGSWLSWGNNLVQTRDWATWEPGRELRLESEISQLALGEQPLGVTYQGVYSWNGSLDQPTATLHKLASFDAMTLGPKGLAAWVEEEGRVVLVRYPEEAEVASWSLGPELDTPALAILDETRVAVMDKHFGLQMLHADDTIDSFGKIDPGYSTYAPIASAESDLLVTYGGFREDHLTGVDLKTGKVLWSQYGPEESTRAIALTHGGERVWTNDFSNWPVMWNARTGEPLLRVITWPDGGVLLHTPSGDYDGNRAGLNKVAWHEPGSDSLIEQDGELRRKHYQPEKVRAILRGE